MDARCSSGPPERETAREAVLVGGVIGSVVQRSLSVAKVITRQVMSA